MKQIAVLILAVSLAACATITPAKVDQLAASLLAAHERAVAANDVAGLQCWARGLSFIPALRIIAKPATGTFDRIEQAHLQAMLADQARVMGNDCAALLEPFRSIMGFGPTRRLGLPF